MWGGLGATEVQYPPQLQRVSPDLADPWAGGGGGTLGDSPFARLDLDPELPGVESETLWIVWASPRGGAGTATPPDPHPPRLPCGLECPLPRPPTLACRSLFNPWMKLIYWRRAGHPTGSSSPAGPRRPLMRPAASRVERRATCSSCPLLTCGADVFLV